MKWGSGVHGRAVPPLSLGRICWAYGVGGVIVGVRCPLRSVCANWRGFGDDGRGLAIRRMLCFAGGAGVAGRGDRLRAEDGGRCHTSNRASRM